MADESAEAGGHTTLAPVGAGAAARRTAWDRFYAYCLDIISRCNSLRRLREADRDDCVQDVMVELVRRFNEDQCDVIPDPEELTGWLRVVTRSKAADIGRRHQRRPETSFDDGAGGGLRDEAPALARDESSLNLLWEALVDLDEEVTMTSYLIFYLRTIEGWAVPAIADLFGITPEQARFRCCRVKKRFEDIVKRRMSGRMKDESRGMKEWACHQ